jgi:hypothetical protein
MKLPTLKRDTATEIKKATDQSAQAAAKLVSLREERAGLLVEADIEAIAPIDAQIAAQERLISTLQERLRALDERHKKERHANRLSEKEKAVAAFAKEYRAKRVDPALHIIELWGQLGDAYKEYRGTRDTQFRTKWRTDLFPNYVGDRYSPFAPVDNLLHLIVGAMGLDPASADTRLAEARIRTANIAENLKTQADAYLAALQEASLPPVTEEDAP